MTVTADTMTLFLMASGVTLVIMMGGIDLSVQAVASMTSCILAAYLPRYGVLAIPLAVLGGVIAGFAGGIVSTRLRIPSFIATLAVSGVVISAGYWFSDTRSVNIPAELRDTYLGWAVGDTLGVPNEIWVGVVFLVLLSAILQLTPFGRLVRGIGAQERAVIASGINVDRTKILGLHAVGHHGGHCRHRHGGAPRLGLADLGERIPAAGDRLASSSAAPPSPAASARSGALSSAPSSSRSCASA